ncbi:hypothetical protein HMPREF3226_02211 [Prevotella corporis]|uniref:Uncharacterized protein n=1 Tax=Prevotella corporis TaxID=28128 RepID=A0A133PXK7_9BACT|nr:hypothetical protein HMPREF3226_02211 [Prevotella corporis]
MATSSGIRWQEVEAMTMVSEAGDMECCLWGNKILVFEKWNAEG